MNDKCKHCGGELKTIVRDGGPHYADLRCSACNRHNGFAPKPDAERIKRPAAHTDLVAKFGQGFCEMCLRSKAELGKTETLEAQHVHEYQDGGKPTRENIWIICTSCHKFIHWVRTYHGHNKVELDSEGTEGRESMAALEVSPPWE